MAQETKIEYSHPEVLVDTQWVEEHLNDKDIRIVEIDYDPQTNYYLGHIPGSALLDWRKDINDPLTRNVLSVEKYIEVLRKLGIDNDSRILILYGDLSNWFAAFAFWVFKYYNYPNIKLINGGRKKWLEEDRPLTKDIIHESEGKYKKSGSFEPNEKIMVYLSDIKNALISRRKFQIRLVDVRSPPEYYSEIAEPREYPAEHAQRAGHIPGAHNIPWAKVLNEDATFKSASELSQLYISEDVLPENEVIIYCRIEERSSHS